MVYKVLIVDDSNFFQTRLKEMINENPELNVVGIASNGRDAIDMTAKLQPDIISMDYEMPMLDGISAVKTIMSATPTPIIMFSSMTYEGAKITLDALAAGALDFMNKNFAEVSNDSAEFKRRLHEKLITFARGKQQTKTAYESTSLVESPNLAVNKAVQTARKVDSRKVNRPRIDTNPIAKDSPKRDLSPSVKRKNERLKGRVKLLAIGASTGGPVALTNIICNLPKKFPVPVIIIQHMPENFTKAFAERLNRSASLFVKEAETGDRIETGKVYVAPGGKQLIVDRNGGTIKIIEGDHRVNYRPCVDITFASVANIFKDSVLAVVLTGMGSDGCEGARILKEKGSSLWSQDEHSSVVYGMPAAVARANLSDRVLPLDDFANQLVAEL